MIRKRILTAVLAVVVVAASMGASFYFGFSEGKKVPNTILVKGVSNINQGQPADVNFNTFWQAWQIINDSYLRNASTSAQDKVHGAVNGLVNSLGDRYSEFFNPKDNQQFQENVDGNFGGIGAELGIKNDQLVVIAPLKDTPAMKAGLMAGDAILAIDASSTDGISIDDAVNSIRGLEGSSVKLTIMRDGWDKPKDFSITRGNIAIPTLDTKTVGGDLTQIQLYGFNANADSLFYQAMFKAVTNGSKGLILDLRGNPGGYLEVAVDLAGWFLPRGKLVVSEAGRSGTNQEFRASGNAALADFPTVVLIDGGSASASEILAGALRDQRNIKLIGETSFGKGTVQQLMPLSDGSSIKLTVAHWVLPSGHILENGGLKPDYEVPLNASDTTAGKDPQLDKAIEILHSEISK
ncbi:MAG: S41 family peptidase [Patescibacteria group bacterium]|nr:S41 family peptidase [Patescibacteria group bacterium]MDE2015744.1 S41 family peptidase [Patescibacteria group bacterium]MDE2226801.1 S41 family peptidase [Patescibacteria group bacterium]